MNINELPNFRQVQKLPERTTLLDIQTSIAQQQVSEGSTKEKVWHQYGFVWLTTISDNINENEVLLIGFRNMQTATTNIRHKIEIVVRLAKY